MAITQCFPVVTESNYPAIAQLCVHSFVGDDHATLLKHLAKRREDFQAKGGVAVDVNIDPVGLQQWLGGRIATPADLSKYATFVRYG